MSFVIDEAKNGKYLVHHDLPPLESLWKVLHSQHADIVAEHSRQTRMAPDRPSAKWYHTSVRVVWSRVELVT